MHNFLLEIVNRTKKTVTKVKHKMIRIKVIIN